MCSVPMCSVQKIHPSRHHTFRVKEVRSTYSVTPDKVWICLLSHSNQSTLDLHPEEVYTESSCLTTGKRSKQQPSKHLAVFNVERAPWWGGWCLRENGQIDKTLLTKSRAHLSHDELLTAVINSRPTIWRKHSLLLTPSHLIV